MSKAAELLPPIRLLARAEEAVGKTVKAFGGDEDRKLMLFEDGTGLCLVVNTYRESVEISAETTLTPISLADYLWQCGVLSEEQRNAVFAMSKAELEEAAEELSDRNERAEFERLRAKFEGTG